MATRTEADPDVAIPPGEYLGEEIAARTISQKEFAPTVSTMTAIPWTRCGTSVGATMTKIPWTRSGMTTDRWGDAYRHVYCRKRYPWLQGGWRPGHYRKLKKPEWCGR